MTRRKIIGRLLYGVGGMWLVYLRPGLWVWLAVIIIVAGITVENRIAIFKPFWKKWADETRTQS